MPVKNRHLSAVLAALILLSPLRAPWAAQKEGEIPTLPVLPAIVAPAVGPLAAPIQAPNLSAPAGPAAPTAQAPRAPGAQALRPLAEVQQKLAARPDNAGQTLNAAFDQSAPKGETPAAEAAPSRAQAPSAEDWTQGVFLPKTIDKPLAGDALGVTVHRLSNGMTVYLSPNRQEPRVNYAIAVRAGSRHDPLEATGMAHYLEHMQFKGTQRLGTIDYAREKPHLDKIQELYDRHFAATDPQERARIYAEIDAESQLAARYAAPNEFDKLYAAEGFSGTNAYTSKEQTVYHGSFPSNKAGIWARVETDRLSNPVYRIFLPELEAVYEEYNRGLDNPDAEFFAGARERALFAGHPYGRDVIGLGEHLKNPSISRMRKFFSDYYRPNNMAIVLSGDFDRQKMLALLEANFGKLSPAKIPQAPAAQVEKIKGVRRSEVRFEAEEAVQIDWQVPGNGDPDAETLILAGKVLSNLIRDRVNAAQLVKEAGAHVLAYNEAGGWLALALPKEGQTVQQAEQVLMTEIARFKAGNFTQEDVRAAITQLEVEQKKKLQDNEQRADVLTQSFVEGEEWAHAAASLDRLKRLTKSDVLRAANRYLGEDRVVIYRRKGASDVEKVAKPVFTPVPIDTSRQSAFFKEMTQTPTDPIEPHFLRRGRDYQTLDRAWGRLYWTRNPVTDLFTLELRFDRGNAQEKRLDLALALMKVSGAGQLTAEEFNKKLSALGSTIVTRCEEQDCIVKLTGIEANLKETVRLALLHFSEPNVPKGAFRQMIAIERGDREDRKLDVEEVKKALAEYASRGKDSEYLKELASRDLGKLTQQELKGVLRGFFDFRRDVLYTGRKPPKELAGLLSAAQKRRSFRKPPARKPVKLLKPARARVVFVHHEGMKQALVGAYAADGPFDPKQRLDYRVYNMTMGGGMGGVYFQEMRESRALAYSAQGGYQPAQRAGDDNHLFAEAGTQADKAVETAKMMIQLMREPPVTPQRFAVAKSQAEESFRADVPQLEDIPRKVRTWERLGFEKDPGPESMARLPGYAAERLARFTSRFKDKPLTLYVLGDRNSVDLEGLKKLGDFEERDVDELFPH